MLTIQLYLYMHGYSAAVTQYTITLKISLQNLHCMHDNKHESSVAICLIFARHSIINDVHYVYSCIHDHLFFKTYLGYNYVRYIHIVSYCYSKTYRRYVPDPGPLYVTRPEKTTCT